MKYTPDQVRAGKKLVEYFITRNIKRDEARERARDLLQDHAPDKIMRALSDPSTFYKVQNLYNKLNYKTLRHLNK